MVLLRIRERLGDSHSAGPETELAGLTVSGLTGKTNFNLYVGCVLLARDFLGSDL